jgi:arylsulfatase A-like enzyme/Tfp pilus assembly protein PilF
MAKSTVSGRRGRTLAAAAVACLGAAAFAGWAWWHLRGPRPLPGPIILISVDTLRADHLPIYGYRHVETPAIDALAADGVVFEHAWTHSPLTLPAHTSILSGRLPFEHGVRDNLGFSVKPQVPLLPSLLKPAGYATAGVVSAYVLRRETGIAHGFDFFDSQLPVASPELSFGQVQRDGAQSVQIATDWIGRQASPRYFLFLHLYEPHKPYTPPARYARYAPYDGEIAYADELVGRLVTVLKSRGEYDQALVVFLSDHGEGLGDHGEEEHGLFLYTETTRVPLVVKLPGSAGRGRRVGETVQHIDLVPTILDLAGAPPAPGLRGRSLRPLLFATGPVRESGVYSESLYARYHFGWSELYALTDARYRFIKAPRREFYDLRTDPGERTNLFALRAQAAAASEAALDRLVAGHGVDIPSSVSREDLERLQALGYVGTEAAVGSQVAGDTLPDPKDQVATLTVYRHAVDLAGERRYGEAIPLLQRIVADNPAMADVWLQLANLLVRVGQMEQALAAYRRLIALHPTDPSGLLGAAGALLSLKQYDEATRHAELAASAAPAGDRRQLGSAYEMLARIALARGDNRAALDYARQAQEADAGLPMSPFVEGLMRYRAGRYAEALPFFEQALHLLEGHTLTLGELQYYTGDTLARLGRFADAEPHLKEELRLFPQNGRAWAALAMLYYSTNRDADVQRTIDGLLRAIPTSEGASIATELWRIFGQPARARTPAHLAR